MISPDRIGPLAASPVAASLLRVALAVLAVYALFAALVWLFADRLVFQPQPPAFRASDLVRIPVDGGDTVTARWLPNPDATYTLLFSHGNAEDLGDLEPFLRDLHAAGFQVLAWDYRGYGASTGRPSERTAYRDADAVFAHLTGALGVPAERVIAHGRSLGGGPATDLAARHPVAGLVLESTFTSVFAVAPGIAILPFDKFRNERRLARVRAPVLVIHGREDEVVAFSHGERLFRAAPGPRRHVWIDGAGHNDLLIVAGDRYYAALRDFAAWLPSVGSTE